MEITGVMQVTLQATTPSLSVWNSQVSDIEIRMHSNVLISFKMSYFRFSTIKALRMGLISRNLCLEVLFYMLLKFSIF